MWTNRLLLLGFLFLDLSQRQWRIQRLGDFSWNANHNRFLSTDIRISSCGSLSINSAGSNSFLSELSNSGCDVHELFVGVFIDLMIMFFSRRHFSTLKTMYDTSLTIARQMIYATVAVNKMKIVSLKISKLHWSLPYESAVLEMLRILEPFEEHRRLFMIVCNQLNLASDILVENKIGHHWGVSRSLRSSGLWFP